MNEEARELEAARQGHALRMSLGLRIQHIFFALCIVVLALTGLALLFGDTAFGSWLVWLVGGFENRGLLHRWAAVGLILSVVYHLAYSLFSNAGSREFRLRRLGSQDVKLFAESVRYAAGRRPNPPPIGKYSFGQKLHYWLAGLMAVTMILTGLVLWDPTAAMTLLPQWAMQIVLVLHGYEGLLVFVVIVIWHVYDVHLCPRRFPGTLSWLTGRIPLDEAKLYHRGEYDRLKSLLDESDD